MTAQEYWTLFMETGAPEAYLLYIGALRTEGKHVPENQGLGAADHRLQ